VDKHGAPLNSNSTHNNAKGQTVMFKLAMNPKFTAYRLLYKRGNGKVQSKVKLFPKFSNQIHCPCPIISTSILPLLGTYFPFHTVKVFLVYHK